MGNDHERIKEREQRENNSARNRARQTQKSITFIAEDGCEVTVTPEGHVFHNVGDWW